MLIKKNAKVYKKSKTYKILLKKLFLMKIPKNKLVIEKDTVL